MYDMQPESIKAFILDRNVKLPRFQRKQTWDAIKNFQLCISVFNQYPMGVCILNVDKEDGKQIRWLLDGRQRRNALSEMYRDPENIYNWGVKFIGIKNNDQPDQLDDKFWSKINVYIESDANSDNVEDNSDSIDNEISEDISETEIDTCSPDSTNEMVILEKASGLSFLLEVIKTFHNQRQRCNGFTKSFDFGNCISHPPYITTINGKERIVTKDLKTFIDTYRTFCDDHEIDHLNQESFYNFIQTPKSGIGIENDKKLKEQINKNWKEIVGRFYILDKLDSIFTSSKIGVIEVRDIKPADAQKIFNIINSEGEKLTAVEILSAKPHWNQKINNPSPEAIKAVQKIYNAIGIPASQIGDTVVKWDLPATLVLRIGHNLALSDYNLPDEGLNKTQITSFTKMITLGFKLLSGIYSKGVTKEDFEDLGKKSNNSWPREYEAFVYDIKKMFELIEKFNYFKFIKSWSKNLIELTSEGVALNFIIIAYLDWKRKAKPLSQDAMAKIFQKNCFVLWDKMLYEYVTKQWKGAGDGTIASNIVALSNENDQFTPISEAKWRELLDEIFEKNTISSKPINQELMEPLLYHFYCLNQMMRPSTGESIEVDHIIPKKSWKNSITIPNRDTIKDNLLNLGLLPKTDNASKNDKTLLEISGDTWLSEMVEKYEFINKNDFTKYSDVNNYMDMYKERKELFYNAYSEKRNTILNN